MTRKQKRLAIILGLAVVVGIAVALILNALREQVTFFVSPTELAEQPELTGQAIRIGGLVMDGSWEKVEQHNSFVVTDGATELSVTYEGILPDLFREGQGVVAEGRLGADGTFAATTVLAKHDENYIPREVQAALEEQGEWRGN